MTNVPADFVSVLGGNLVKDVSSPDITLLDVIQALVAPGGEHIDGLDVTNFIVISPVIGQLGLGLLGSGEPLVPGVSHDEGHVSAPLSVGSQTL